MSDAVGHTVSLGPAFALGFGAGALYFALLWRSVRYFTGGGPGWRFVLALVLRLALVLGTLAGLVWTGAGLSQILAAMLGFALARVLASRLARVGLAEE